MLIGTGLSAGEARPGPELGSPATAAELIANDWSVMPDGAGLPKGGGTVRQGKRIYEAQCIACHGTAGTGESGDQLAAAQMQLTDEWPEKTIGTYWPYATTLFDFIRRSKPMMQPGSLDDSEVYAVSAYLLYLNGIIPAEQLMNAESLKNIKMPNRDGFIKILK